MHCKRLVFIGLASIVSFSAGAALPSEKDSLHISHHDARQMQEDSLRRLFQIDEVVVVARQEKDVMPPQTLKGEQLQVLSTTSVADAVRYFSGVQIKDYGGVGGMRTVDVRSMGSHHLGVFYDGIEIGNAQNGTVDLGKFSMDNLEEIALYNGQKSEIFQTAKDFGNAGTLYLKTRRPKFSAEKPYNISVKMRGGSFGLASPSLLYEQKLSDHVHLSLNAEYTYAHGRYHFRYRHVTPSGQVTWDTTAVRQNGDVQAFRAEAGVFGYTDVGKWHVKGYYYQSERGIPGAIVNNVWKNAQRQWDRNAFVQGHYSVSLSRTVDLQVNAKYANDKMRYQNPDSTLMWLDQTYLQQEVYASVASRWRIFPFWDVALAADYDLNWLESDTRLFVRPLRHNLLVSAASAVSYKWLKLQGSILETFIADALRAEPEIIPPSSKAKNRYNALTPAVYFNAKPILHEEWYLRAFYKQNYRMPTFNDLYYQEVGSADLQPERARQMDVGTEYTWSKKGLMGGESRLTLGVKGDLYFNQIHNKIVAIPKGNSQYRWMMMNLGYVEILGTELAADLGLYFSPEHALLFHAGYTYQRAMDKTNPKDNDSYGGTYRGQIAYIPRHSGSATVTYRWKHLQLAYAFVAVGSRYRSSANIPVNRVPAWYTSDISISYTWSLGKGPHPMELQAGLEANNIFNQQYEVIPNYPMPGINGKGILQVRF